MIRNGKFSLLKARSANQTNTSTISLFNSLVTGLASRRKGVVVEEELSALRRINAVVVEEQSLGSFVN